MLLIESFKKKLRIDEKNDKTIRAYIDDIKQFERYIKEKRSIESIDYKDITLFDIEDFLYYIKEHGGRNNSNASVQTQNRKIMSLRKFYNFLYSRDIIEKNIMKSIEKIKDKEEKKISTLTLEEIKLLKQAPYNSAAYQKETEFQKARDNLILYLFLNAGLRDEELRELKEENIDLANKIVNVEKAKMNQSRSFYIDDEGTRLVKEYLYQKSIKKNIKDKEYLFISIKGNRLKYTSSTRDILKRLLEVSGIDHERINCISQHKLRHTFATMSLRNGNVLENISTQLGHSSVNTTRRFYIHESPQDIKGRKISLNY